MMKKQSRMQKSDEERKKDVTETMFQKRKKKTHTTARLTI